MNLLNFPMKFQTFDILDLLNTFKSKYNVKFNGNKEDLELFEEVRYTIAEELNNYLLNSVNEDLKNTNVEEDYNNKVDNYLNRQQVYAMLKEYSEYFTKQSSRMYYYKLKELEESLKKGIEYEIK